MLVSTCLNYTEKWIGLESSIGPKITGNNSWISKGGTWPVSCKQTQSDANSYSLELHMPETEMESG
jgi:hypothetical protein